MGCVPSFQPSYGEMNFTVDEVCDHVQTGDLIFWSGTRVTAREISAITESQWSHVAMVLVNPKDPPGFPVIIESVTHGDSKLVDIVTKEPASGGVRIVPLRDALMKFNGNAVALRELRATVGCRQRIGDLIFRTIMQDIHRYHGKPYESRWSEFFWAKFQCCWKPNKPTTDSYFCSELIAQILIDAGMLDGTRVCANQFFPSDLSETSGLQIQSPPSCPGVAVDYSANKFIALPTHKGDILDRFFSPSVSPPKN